MTTTNKNFLQRIQPEINARMKSYEKNFGELNPEEKALVKIIITSLITSRQVKRAERNYQLLNSIHIN